MPQSSDTLPELLTSQRREALRELFLNEVTTLSCVYWRNSAPWSVVRRICHDTFLLFPVKGAFRVHLDHRSFVVKPGRFLILPANVPHSLEIAKSVRHLRQYSLHCHLHDRWRRSISSRLTHQIGTLDYPAGTHEALSELTSLMNSDSATAQAFGAVLVRTLLAAEFRSHQISAPPESRSDPRIQRVLERLDAEYSSCDISVEGLAGSVRLTSVQFRKLFRRETGESPGQYIHSLRLRHATRLLRHTTSSVKEISALCGFASDHYFHLAFRRKFHRTPSQYRLDSLI